MKYISRFIIIIFSFFIHMEANSQVWGWIDHAGSGAGISGHGITTDIWGNVYVIGSYSNSAKFQDTTFWASSSYAEFFVTKYNRHGNRLWIHNFLGPRNCLGYNIKTDELGYIYIMGDPTLFFVNLTPSLQMVDMFVAKMDPYGNFLWGTEISSATGFKSSLDVDNVGNSYATFTSNSTGNFGNIVLNNSNSGNDIGIGKLDPNGNAVWAKILTTYGSSHQGYDIDINNNGDLAVAGGTPSEGLAVILDPLNGDTIQALELDSGTASATAILVDDFGNYVVCGNFTDTAWFGPYTLVPKGLNDIFIASFDINGNVNWVKEINGLGSISMNLMVRSIESDSLGNYFISGRIADLTAFDTDTIAANGNDAFIAKYDKNGVYYWSENFGITNGTDDAFDHHVDRNGMNYITGYYSGTLGFFGNDTLPYAGGSTNYYAAQFIGNANIVSGNVFYDANSNLVQDSTESSLEGHFISGPTNNLYAYTNASGYYMIPMDSGNYTITPSLPLYHVSTPLNYNGSFSGFGLRDSLLDFGISPIAGIKDARIDIEALTPARPGFETAYQISYTNIGTDTLNGSISLNYDTLFTFDSAQVNPAFQNSDSLYWSYNNLGTNQLESNILYFTLNSSAVLGDTIEFIAKITPYATDTVPENNIDTFKQEIVGSYDPNDKSVIPNTDVYLSFVQSTSPFEYLIRFQNTGTDTAFTVIIVDTISPLLDLNSFKVISSSHNYRVEMRDNRRLEFIFENINLPDSGVNLIGSNGFIKYSIKPYSSVGIGQEFRNTAYIYFDYNYPIITNTTSNFVILINDNKEWIKGKNNLKIYPNPSSYILNIETKNLIDRVEIYDITSKMVLLNEKHGSEIDVSKLTQGTYILSIIIGGERINQKFIKR